MSHSEVIYKAFQLVLDGHLPSDIRELLIKEGSTPNIADAAYREAVIQASSLPLLSEVERVRLRAAQLDRLACKASSAMDYGTARACLVDAQKLDEKAYLLEPGPIVHGDANKSPAPPYPSPGWTQ